MAMSAIGQIYKGSPSNPEKQTAGQSSSRLDVAPGLPLNGGHEEGSNTASILLDGRNFGVVLRNEVVSRNAFME